METVNLAIPREEAVYPTCKELDAWFSVLGDMDDFIFYHEPEHRHSER